MKEDVPTRDTANRFRWWVPLLVPMVILILLAIDATNRGTHVVRPRFLGELIGVIIIGLVVGLPAFIAGVLYHRQNH